MPSFDVASEVDMHEATNAIDQANREVGTRFDFRGSNARFSLAEDIITLDAENEFQLQQMLDILHNKLVKRGIDIACLEIKDPEMSGQRAHQTITLRQGINQPMAKKIVKLVKDKKLKVQAAVQGDKVRITGKKRDDLQLIIALIKDAGLDLPLQYINFRD